MAAMLAAAGRRHRFSTGEIIQQKGDLDGGFWMIMAGTVMVCRFGREGELTVYAVLGPGDLFGELACFAGVPRQVDAVAESDAELIRVDAALIDRLLSSEKDFARWLLKSLAMQLQTALDRIEGDRSLSAEARLALRLAEMSEREGPVITATQQQLADLVGISRVTAGQILARFATDGLVRQGYGTITLTDASTLAARGQQKHERIRHVVDL